MVEQSNLPLPRLPGNTPLAIACLDQDLKARASRLLGSKGTSLPTCGQRTHRQRYIYRRTLFRTVGKPIPSRFLSILKIRLGRQAHTEGLT